MTHTLSMSRRIEIVDVESLRKASLTLKAWQMKWAQHIIDIVEKNEFVDRMKLMGECMDVDIQKEKGEALSQLLKVGILVELNPDDADDGRCIMNFDKLFSINEGIQSIIN